MGLRALVGIHQSDGTYRARHVHMDGCPTIIVPVLSTLVHRTHGGDVTEAAEHLLRTDWRRLYLLPAPVDGPPELITDPSDFAGEVQTGRLDWANAGDREWAYLFDGDHLHLHLGVFPEQGPKQWRTWHSWPVRDLPTLPPAHLADVQARGYLHQRQATFHRTCAELVRERFQEATS